MEKPCSLAKKKLLAPPYNDHSFGAAAPTCPPSSHLSSCPLSRCMIGLGIARCCRSGRNRRRSSGYSLLTASHSDRGWPMDTPAAVIWHWMAFLGTTSRFFHAECTTDVVMSVAWPRLATTAVGSVPSQRSASGITSG